jgi:HK97 family phage prohead protease
MSEQTKYSPDMTSQPAEREIRTAVLKLEKRESAPSVLVGYASTFDQPYSVERVQETIDRRAFDRTLVEQPDVFALIGHDQSRVIARTKNGTLSLLPDEVGLRVEISQVDTTESRDAFALVESGTIDSMSFGFSVVNQKFENRDGVVHRRITDVNLYEVSLVAFPANPAATLSKRARDLAEGVVSNRRAIRLPVEPIYKGMK